MPFLKRLVIGRPSSLVLMIGQRNPLLFDTETLLKQSKVFGRILSSLLEWSLQVERFFLTRHWRIEFLRKCIQQSGGTSFRWRFYPMPYYFFYNICVVSSSSGCYPRSNYHRNRQNTTYSIFWQQSRVSCLPYHWEYSQSHSTKTFETCMHPHCLSFSWEDESFKDEWPGASVFCSKAISRVDANCPGASYQGRHRWHGND